MTPLSLYQADLQKPHFFADDSQAQAIQYLQRLYDDLQNRTPPTQSNGVFSRLFKRPEPKKNDIKGLYFYGGVGRGKTYLMDLFFNSLTSERKSRLHFHHFMLRVHKELTLLAGEKNPLVKIAKKFASETDLICFDEFFVDDITDAMILAGMFEALFAQGVVLVATSNIHPTDLYKNGLQRARFLPAIALIESHCEIYNLDGGKDYRLDRLTEAEIYHSPLGSEADALMSQTFESLANGEKHYNTPLMINDRAITTRAYSVDSLLIDCESLCDGPRAVADYIEIAIVYRTILLSNVPQMNLQTNDMARRFIAMVDEFYNHHVVLIISAEVDVYSLYAGHKLAFEFQRCISRLLEMQSQEYLQKAHHVDL
ncbi:cell division protein ZapE [Psychromonas sp. psych-6C06]|uniref:cell division protein ZapE n=1 Tax=Psychromonas sp. psych-6C06 TaxID=2058089 RepID=UPI000C3418FB|nr:cell division protein ZapE [Psychromonas sp. psych-6C06]PKF62813.1 cell division protein ZapE [Psychromonas sp. psych-6C06]